MWPGIQVKVYYKAQRLQGPRRNGAKAEVRQGFSSPLTDGTKTWPGAEKEEGEEGEEGRDCCFCVGLCASFNAARLLFHGVIVTQWISCHTGFQPQLLLNSETSRRGRSLPVPCPRLSSRKRSNWGNQGRCTFNVSCGTKYSMLNAFVQR
ncbi:hypothetical protein VFPFJ_05708 [Purpureocillium lilacinum]|uniref:Uncharacterized protein n=1 Tax=Purpureocillium lilacinum TaxID=33203 RepID=A0A179HIL2_PURLI|nr:hypothetical protein VFPFJ_05708 [Purpureocillium lilacinum]OAQ89299.1 hypothetical protein VFPFJ_05708 [Purpureocillium lilacinum]